MLDSLLLKYHEISYCQSFNAVQFFEIAPKMLDLDLYNNIFFGKLYLVVASKK